jgi:hypothetical protein
VSIINTVSKTSVLFSILLFALIIYHVHLTWNTIPESDYNFSFFHNFWLWPFTGFVKCCIIDIWRHTPK